MVKGIAASPGIAIGPVWKYHPIEVEIKQEKTVDVDAELKRLHAALTEAKQQLEELGKHAGEQIGEEEAAIFSAHQMFLEDPELISAVEASISQEQLSAPFAVDSGIETYAQMLEQVEDEYFKARAQDIRDVGRRVLYCLMGIDQSKMMSFPGEPSIIVADDLTPSDTVNFKREMVLGFCTVKGGPTSHSAILARSLNLPALVSMECKLSAIQDGERAILDGTEGVLHLNPDKNTLEKAGERQHELEKTLARQLKSASVPAVTKDDLYVEVVANIGSHEDSIQANQFGADGVGLLRTEFLYLDRKTMPSEEEQIEAYQAIDKEMAGKPMVVRTLDIGGDKMVPYLGLKEEPNPFLGWRAIRMISENPEILVDQFRALLQGFTQSKLKIMLPMVSNFNEVVQGRELYRQARHSLEEKGVQIAQDVEFGIMVEVPSVVMMIKQISEIVDFFSIGTNDLTQYALAVDRTNERVAKLASPFNPAVLRLISRTIKQAHKKNRWVGLCGEMAGDPLATKLLLGFGLDEFSMAPGAIPVVKEIIRDSNQTACKVIAKKALSFSTTEEVKKYLAEL
ncbi:MAG: phosphoenolpyruvate--protein phosphotransferase [Chloroflexota bacterium]